MRAVTLAIGIAAPAIGCSSGFGPRTLSSPDPSSKIPAMKSAVDQNDKTSVPALVKDLDSDDPAVRFYANHALQELTGENFGFRYFGSDHEREAAAEKWRQWLAGCARPAGADHRRADCVRRRALTQGGTTRCASRRVPRTRALGALPASPGGGRGFPPPASRARPRRALPRARGRSSTAGAGQGLS